MKKGKFTWIIAGILTVSLLVTACGTDPVPTKPPVPTTEPTAAPTTEPTEPEIVEAWKPNDLGVQVSPDSLYVQKVENLPEGFIMGTDASCVPALEESGVKYYDFDGAEKDVYQILAENGDKLIVRIPTVALSDEQRKAMVYGSTIYVTCEGKVMHFFDEKSEKNLLV